MNINKSGRPEGRNSGKSLRKYRQALTCRDLQLAHILIRVAEVGGGYPMHYRLRCAIGFLNVQKKPKSKRSFLTQGIPKSENFALFVKIMTQILYQKNFITFSESKYGQNHGQCSEKVERGLSGG